MRREEIEKVEGWGIVGSRDRGNPARPVGSFFFVGKRWPIAEKLGNLVGITWHRSEPSETLEELWRTSPSSSSSPFPRVCIEQLHNYPGTASVPMTGIPNAANSHELQMGESNLRPIAIFSSYMLLCLSLAIFIIRNLFKSYSSLSTAKSANPKPHLLRILLFSGLATASLATTWYYMFQFFADSYRNWLVTQQLHQQFFFGHGAEGLQLGSWLRDTQLFKEAWGSVLIGIERFWWSSQIFLFASYLGWALEVKGTIARSTSGT